MTVQKYNPLLPEGFDEVISEEQETQLSDAYEYGHKEFRTVKDIAAGDFVVLSKDYENHVEPIDADSFQLLSNIAYTRAGEGDFVVQEIIPNPRTPGNYFVLYSCAANDSTSTRSFYMSEIDSMSNFLNHVLITKESTGICEFVAQVVNDSDLRGVLIFGSATQQMVQCNYNDGVWSFSAKTAFPTYPEFRNIKTCKLSPESDKFYLYASIGTYISYKLFLCQITATSVIILNSVVIPDDNLDYLQAFDVNTSGYFICAAQKWINGNPKDETYFAIGQLTSEISTVSSFVHYPELSQYPKLKFVPDGSVNFIITNSFQKSPTSMTDWEQRLHYCSIVDGAIVVNYSRTYGFTYTEHGDASILFIDPSSFVLAFHRHPYLAHSRYKLGVNTFDEIETWILQPTYGYQTVIGGIVSNGVYFTFGSTRSGYKFDNRLFISSFEFSTNLKNGLIGQALEPIPSTQPGAVRMLGGVFTGFTALTRGEIYFLQGDGSLKKESENNGGVLVGFALSSSELKTVKSFHPDLLEKLKGVEENANNYQHPETHSIDMITDSATHVKMTVAERSKLTAQPANPVTSVNGQTGNVIISIPEPTGGDAVQEVYFESFTKTHIPTPGNYFLIIDKTPAQIADYIAPQPDPLDTRGVTINLPYSDLVDQFGIYTIRVLSAGYPLIADHLPYLIQLGNAEFSTNNLKPLNGNVVPQVFELPFKMGYGSYIRFSVIMLATGEFSGIFLSGQASGTVVPALPYWKWNEGTLQWEIVDSTGDYALIVWEYSEGLFLNPEVPMGG